MPIILHIETSTNVCSIALSENNSCIFSRSNYEGLNHAKLLSPFIKEALGFLEKENKKLDAIAVSSGPGSYTGLRIGVSTAKGLCYGLNIPLIAVSTLATMSIAASSQIKEKENILLCPMIDARRMEVYTAFFDINSKLIKEDSADIISEDSYKKELNQHKIYFFGNGAAKCKNIITHPNAFFIENINPLAENMILLAEKDFLENKFEDIAYFEPFYLKEFYSTQQHG